MKFNLISKASLFLGRYNDNKNDNDDDRYATPNIRGSRGNIPSFRKPATG